MNYQAGDLLLMAFPYVGGAQSKVRPALVLLDMGEADVLVARVTTQLYGTPYDVLLAGWRQAGLRALSVARLHKLAALEKTLIVRQVGHVAPADRLNVAAVLRQVFGTW
jgi:mRNA interferase MazF